MKLIPWRSVALLIASDLQKDMAGSPLLRGVSFKLERRDRMTIAARNGAGKTTLLRMLAGEESIDGGELRVGRGVRVALHDQRPPRWGRGRGDAVGGGEVLCLRDYVLSGCREELQIEAELAELEASMGGGVADESTFDRYARAQTRLEALGGYLWRDRATLTSRGLGFAEEDLTRPLSTFSGGELTRASLARALATGAEVLLLDEPTNHLDIESLEWLEQTLTTIDAAVVLVAHDRWFLEAVGTSVLEIDGGRSRFFAGSWHAWRREKAARELALGRAIESQQAEIARLERFIARFRYKASKARQAQSRVKRLAKMEKLGGSDGRQQRSLEFDFKAPERSGRVIFEMSGAQITVGGDDRRPERVLIEDAELWLERGEHVCLVGPNGSGKSTLIDTLAGRRELQRGKLSIGHNVKVGYLSQHAEELGVGGDPGQSVLDAAARATGLSPNKARALLGAFLFSGSDADKPLAGLSGGERQRLALAILVQSGANVLILDEPTNHLDLDSREALEDALRAFEGAILLVSHDRALLDAVGARTIALEGQGLRSCLGGWPEYVRLREEMRGASGQSLSEAGEAKRSAVPNGVAPNRAAPNGGAPSGAAPNGGAPSGAAANGAPANGGARAASTAPGRSRAGVVAGAHAQRAPARDGGRRRGPSKNRLREQAQAEAAIEAAEQSLRDLEDELSDPAAWATKYETAKSEARHTAAKRAVEQAYERLQALVD